MVNKIENEIIDPNERSTPEIINIDGSSFVKNHDGSLMKLGGDDYEDSNLIYR
jgi:hypothetical protein